MTILNFNITIVGGKTPIHMVKEMPYTIGVNSGDINTIRKLFIDNYYEEVLDIARPILNEQGNTPVIAVNGYYMSNDTGEVYIMYNNLVNSRYIWIGD